jgi:cyclopropane-fatty-acyl-phospholipid synthase
MVYTCAYFPTPEVSLEEAQLAKLEHVCRKLRLRPGERVVEAGCGWGALALHMAERHGARVTAWNASSTQLELAREAARRRGVADRVSFVHGDYRQIEGRYDAFVSVGMLEHVGREQHAELGRVIGRCLGPGGRGLLHSIGRARALPMNEWVGRRIFPGSYCPTLAEMVSLLEPFGFAVLDVENLRPHYARTLEHWLERFEKHAAEVEGRMGRGFVRAWRLYLCGAIASFRSSSFELFQVLFARPGWADLPWTREHLYAGPAPQADLP